MRLHVHFEAGDIRVDEIVEGDTAEAVTAKMQARVAQEVGFPMGLMIKNLSPLLFAQETIKKYNKTIAASTPTPIPQSCDEFLKIGIEKGFATSLPS